MPTPKGTSDTLDGVSCSSASACVAVGTAFGLSSHRTWPLIEAWSGTAWRVIEAPTIGSFSSLNSVSCTSAKSCVAVGFYHDASGTSQAFAESWNGSSWRIEAAVKPPRSSLLLGVSCYNAHSCIAVGYVNSGVGDARPLSESWNGSQWRLQSVTLPKGSPGGMFDAVSCVSASGCMATGSNFGSSSPSLAEWWNGTNWRVEPTQDPANYRLSFSEDELDGVSCTSPTACVASGEYSPNGTAAYYLEQWNGSHFQLRLVPHAAGFQQGSLLSVSCSDSACTTVGDYARHSGNQLTLALAD